MQSSIRFFDGISAKARNVTLEITTDSLILLDGDEDVARCMLDQLRDENNPPTSQRLNLSMEREGSARILVENEALVRQLLATCPDLRKKRQQPAGWWRPYAIGGSAAIAAVVLFFMFGLPILASAVANMVPAETREKIGLSVENHLIEAFSKKKKEEAVCQSDAGQAALEKLTQQFMQASELDIPPISVTVVTSKHANAFALPGGRMVILSALIEKADNPNAFAGIIAHEFGHIEGKHPTSLFAANIGVAAILSLAFGDVSGGTVLAGVGQMALGAAYSRDFERYADTRAIELMTAWDYDISPSVSLLESLAGKTQKEMSFFSFFASHPDMGERVAQIKAAGKTGDGAAFTAEEWQAIKIMCSKSI